MIRRRTRLFLCALGLSLTSMSMSCAGPFDQCVKPYTSQVTWTGSVTELGEVVGAFLACDPTFSAGEAPVCAVQSLQTLERTLGPDGKAIVDCLVAYFETNGSGQQQAAAKAVGAKRGIHQHALSCQKYHLAAFSPGDATPKGGPTALSGDIGISEFPVFESLASCPGSSVEATIDGRPACVDVGDGPGHPIRLVGWLKAPRPTPPAIHSGDLATFAYAGPNPGAALASCDRECGDNAHGSIAPPGGCECWRKVESDNPPCVNPAHLFSGTQIENVADMTAKGRAARGEMRPNAKVTANDVIDIRTIVAFGAQQKGTSPWSSG